MVVLYSHGWFGIFFCKNRFYVFLGGVRVVCTVLLHIYILSCVRNSFSTIETCFNLCIIFVILKIDNLKV